jgi:hypothetical protein
LPPSTSNVYRGRVSLRHLSIAVTATAVLILGAACTTVDPGPNFVIPDETFNADYFFCHVEPELIYAKKCGDSKPGSCHFNSSAVSGMALVDHKVVDCGGGDKPLNSADVAVGTSARANYTAASLVMTRDYQTAPLYVRPLCRTDSDCSQGHSHPLGLFATNDPVVDVIKTWAQKP